MSTTMYEKGSPEAATPRRPSPLLRPVRIGTVLFGAGIIGLGALSAVTVFATREKTEILVISEEVTALTVDVNAGDVTVLSNADTDQVRVEVTTRSSFREPTWSHGMDQGRLTLEGACQGAWPIDACSVSYQVLVPDGLSVDVHTGSGDQDLVGAFGTTRLNSGSGDILASGVQGAFRARTGSGNIQAPDLDSVSAELQTGSGDVDAEFRKQPIQVSLRTGSGDVQGRFLQAPTNVTAKTGSGNVELVVPSDGTAYDVTGTTGSGDRSIEVPTGDADHRISADTGSGDVHVTVG